MVIGKFSLMGSARKELEFDVDDTIFVPVGTNVDDCQSTLIWAVHNFSGKKFCLLHVHQPALKNEEQSSNPLNEHVANAFQEQRKKLIELLNQYSLILGELGVQARKVCIETDSVERGIVEIIAEYGIRWLVMGSETYRYNLKLSRTPTELKSKKASFVCQQAPICCHIWFVCRGRLIYSRGGRQQKLNQLLLQNLSDMGIDRYESREGRPEKFNQLLLQNSSDIGINQSDHPGPESMTCKLNFIDAQEKENAFDVVLRRFSSQALVDSKCSNNAVLGTSRPTLLLKDEGEQDGGKPVSLTRGVLEEATVNVKCIKLKKFEEVELWGEEDAAMRAKIKAKSLEHLCAEEMSKRQEMEESLEREKQEVERLNNERDEILKELNKVQEQNYLLEKQASENQHNVEEVEEKIFAAVELLVSFKEQRDKLRIEHETATNKLRQLKMVENPPSPGFYSAEMPTFSFMEIIEATQNFDPSWKIGEGRHGSIYKGLLRHIGVAIKMFPSYGPHSQSQFQYEVEVLSRVRHPNLVSIIGACPESRSVVYENLKNRSLEDQLAGKDSSRPLPWQIRTRIAADICSALIFLHYNKPCIVHGDLKPSKILLDANFVGKLGGLGFSRLIRQEENTFNSASPYNMSKENIGYVDPEYLETGRFTSESDIYSFGVTLLRILTGRAPSGIVKDVKCALQKEKIGTVLDSSAGDWPLDLAEQMALVALRCCEKEKSDRLDLVSELWSVLEPMRSIASTSFSGLKKHFQVPAHFTCPIFQEIMKDPLIAADGFTYEADAIMGWFKSGHNTSPMTNLKLEHCNLVSNNALLNAIQEWQHQV